MKKYNFYKNAVYAAITYFAFMTGWCGLEITMTGKSVHGIIENTVGVIVFVLIFYMWRFKFERDIFEEQLEEIKKC